jgi:hypothetical protein
MQGLLTCLLFPASLGVQLCTGMLPLLHRAAAQNLSNLVWALAKMGYQVAAGDCTLLENQLLQSTSADSLAHMRAW